MAVKSIPLFKNTRCGALGTAGTISSDPVDLREIKDINSMDLTYKLDGTGATCGSSSFTYSVCPVFDGTYVDAGTFGTQGATKKSDIVSLGTLRLSSFMKVNCISGTSAHILLTGELNVR